VSLPHFCGSNQNKGLGLFPWLPQFCGSKRNNGLRGQSAHFLQWNQAAPFGAGADGGPRLAERRRKVALTQFEKRYKRFITLSKKHPFFTAFGLLIHSSGELQSAVTLAIAGLQPIVDYCRASTGLALAPKMDVLRAS
jgi:hypothetical protein